MSKFAFIGAGRMAAAIVEGLIASGAARPNEIACLGGAGISASNLAARTQIRLADTPAELLRGSEAVIIACKPQHLATLDIQMAELTRGRLLISVLAGKRIARLKQAFPHARNIVRTMPNTPGKIGAGITGWCTDAPLSQGDEMLLGQILGALGKDLPIPESQMDSLTAVSGSGPAYVFEFAAALRDAGESVGLKREAAYQLAVETILGAARLLADSPLEAEELRDEVTSPNGTTFAGLKRLEAGGFRALILDTVKAAKARSEELAN